jgi:hypothetical protein
MKKLTALLAGAMLMLGMATSANALALKYSTDGINYTTVTDNGAGDLASAAGTMFFLTSAGGFSSFQVNSNTVSTPALGALFTNTFEITSSGPGTLWLQVSDFPYNLSMPLGSGANSKTGLTFQMGNATVDLETFWGTTLFDMSNLISDIDVFSFGINFDLTTLQAITDPFSLTELLIIHHNGATTSQVTGSLELTPVPEPGTMLLLGAGFLGLAIYGKRRKNA